MSDTAMSETDTSDTERLSDSLSGAFPEIVPASPDPYDLARKSEDHKPEPVPAPAPMPAPAPAEIAPPIYATRVYMAPSTDPEGYIEKSMYYIKNPEMQKPFIEKVLTRIQNEYNQQFVWKNILSKILLE